MTFGYLTQCVSDLLAKAGKWRSQLWALNAIIQVMEAAAVRVLAARGDKSLPRHGLWVSLVIRLSAKSWLRHIAISVLKVS